MFRETLRATMPMPRALRLLLALLPMALITPLPALADTWVFNATWPQANHHTHRRIAFTDPAAAPAPAAPAAAAGAAAAAAAHDPTGGDPCAVLHQVLSSAPSVQGAASKLLFVRPRDVVACTQSVAFEPSRDLENLDSVAKYLRHFYSLLHIAKRAPDPRFPSHYDVLGALEQLRGRDWSSAEDFYNALILAVRGLNDAHTALKVNCPPFSHVLALPLVVVSWKGKPTVQAAPRELLSAVLTQVAAQAPFAFDAHQYQGARVVRINGQDAWEAFREYADRRAGFFHDLAQRINFAAVSSSGSVGAYNQRLMNPGADFVELELIRRGGSSSEKVLVPWLSVTDAGNLEGFQSTQKYASGFCLPPPASSLGASALGWQTLHSQGGGQARRVQEMSPGGTTTASASAGGNAGSKPGAAASSAPAGGFGMGRRGLLRVMRRESLDTGNGTSGRNESQAEGPAANTQQGQGQGQSTGLPLFDYSSPDDLHRLGNSVAENSAASPSAVPTMRRVQRTPKQLRQLRQQLQASSPYRHATVLSDVADLFPVLLLSDGKTAVVSITSFEPDAGNGSPLALFLTGAIKAFTLADGAAKRVLVDLAGNGGGLTQLGPWLAGLLLGSDKYPHPRSTMQADYKQLLADTYLATEMAREADGRYNWSSYAAPDEIPYTPRTKGSFFFPIRTRRFAAGAPVGKYSSLFKEDMRSLTQVEGKRFKPILGGKPFALLSDGLCFSTCGTFSTLMTERFGVPSVTVGGIPGRRMAFSGGGGGFILGDVEADMLSMIPASLAQRSDSPRAFTWAMSMSMRFALGYFSGDSQAPIEFTWRPGTVRVEYTAENLVDRSLLLLEAARKVF